MNGIYQPDFKLEGEKMARYRVVIFYIEDDHPKGIKEIIEANASSEEDFRSYLEEEFDLDLSKDNYKIDTL